MDFKILQNLWWALSSFIYSLAVATKNFKHFGSTKANEIIYAALWELSTVNRFIHTTVYIDCEGSWIIFTALTLLWVFWLVNLGEAIKRRQRDLLISLISGKHEKTEKSFKVEKVCEGFYCNRCIVDDFFRALVHG